MYIHAKVLRNRGAQGTVFMYTVKKALRYFDVDNGGANQTTWGSENFYSHVVWFCATVVSIGIWRIPTWLFLQCRVILRYHNRFRGVDTFRIGSRGGGGIHTRELKISFIFAYNYDYMLASLLACLVNPAKRICI
jgi:hypothetical protein